MLAGESQSFSASYDTTAKIVSAAVLVLLVSIVYATRSPITAGAGAFILFLSYSWSPRGYALREGALIVSRLVGEVRIPLDSLREARRATPADLSGCIRLFGSGGLFGWYGLFRTSKLGKCTWYVTDRNLVVVLTAGEKIVLVSPDDMDRFAETIRMVAPLATPTDPALDAPGSYGSLNSSGAIIGWVVGIVGVLIAAFALLYSPGPPTYTLTPDALTIHDRFYPVTLSASSIDVARIRIVDLAVDTDWKPTLRTNGFANPHYRAGSFRVAGGQTVRLYRADAKRLVLLPPSASSGTPVLLETTDPEEFVRQVKQEWSNRS